MNKYQKILLSNLNFIMCSMDELSDISQIIRARQGDKKKTVEFDKNTNTLVINQYDDITITKYALVLGKQLVETLDKIFVFKNDKWEKISVSNIDTKNSFGSTFGFDNPQAYIVPVDFDDKVEKLKLTFANSLADDYIIEIKYVEADKEKYYVQKEQERKEELLKTAEVKVATGVSLVNIYFQPCCEQYDRTEIQLYIPKEYETVGGPYGPVQKPSSWSMIAKRKVDVEDFYKSITGLARGKYSFVLKQFDAQNNLLLETDYMEFEIKS